MTFVYIKEHLPLSGPLRKVVQVVLEFGTVRRRINSSDPLGVISKLEEGSVDSVHSNVDVVWFWTRHTLPITKGGNILEPESSLSTCLPSL